MRPSKLALIFTGILTSAFAAGWLLGWLIVVWKARRFEHRKTHYVPSHV